MRNIFEYHDEGIYLEHHGIKGQKWGVRRYQNSDGSLTAEGKQRYAASSNGRTPAQKAIENGASNYTTPKAKIDAVTEDCWLTTSSGKRATTRAEYDRITDAAKLGLKALRKYADDRGYAYGDLDPDSKGERDWFLYEDQTIGLAMVSDLVNHGYTSTDIKKMCNIVEQNYRLDPDLYYDPNPAIFEIIEGNWGDSLSVFAKYCEEEYKKGSASK